jgi:excinuclease ABC subunit A
MSVDSPLTEKTVLNASEDSSALFDCIRIRGAYEHNLKHLDVDIPLNQLTVITGPSGCGKSSLAFDTLYAEGKRRFMESLSSYARQFMEQFQKARVEEVHNIPPAVGLSQHNPITNARATVGVSIDAIDYLAQLFYYLGEKTCSRCGSHRLVQNLSEDVPAYLFADLPADTAVYLSLQVPKKLMKPLYAVLFGLGYDRILDVNLKPVMLSESMPTWKNDYVHEKQQLCFLLDRFKFKGNIDDALLNRFNDVINRVNQSLELLGSDKGIAWVAHLKTGDTIITKILLTSNGCFDCGQSIPPLSPHHFHYMHPQGACSTCEGYGRVMGLDEARIIPNKKESLRGGAVHAFQTPSYRDVQLHLEQEAKRHGIPINVAYDALSPEDQRQIWDGFGGFVGIRPFFSHLESKRYKMHVRMHLAKYRGYFECTACGGSRLNPLAKETKLLALSYEDWLKTPVQDLLKRFKGLELPVPKHLPRLAVDAWRSLLQRLQWLEAVGLGYLPLLRPLRSLSSGEAHRVQLISSIGSELTETLYVLDEPTVGLHPRDTQHLMSVLIQLKDLGNTVVLVEHDPEVMKHADAVIDMGLGSGKHGGNILFQGTYASLLKSDTQTAKGLKAPKQFKPAPLEPATQYLNIYGASGYNLKNINVRFPVGQLSCVTGVSGSGKSSLLVQTLYGQVLNAQGDLPAFDVLPCVGIEGLEHFTGGVVWVDQSTPARSSRSNPATVVKAYDEIRKLFSESVKAKALGLNAGHFSFNSKGGRCETCEGLGEVSIDMQFMANMTMLCSDCNGKRFQESVLSVELFGRHIHDVLGLSVEEAMQFFKTAPKVRKRLQCLVDLGLGYLPMGQATTTLSGGEAQRLKLAPYLPVEDKPVAKPSLFLFDEPTRGLHMSDVPVLVKALQRLVKVGHTVIVIEHNTQFIREAADWVVDMGPEADALGGHVVYEGDLAGFLKETASVTALYL